MFKLEATCSKRECTHLRHMAQQSKLCQRTQCWWDAAPHQHWRGLGTLCNKLWRKRTVGRCCEKGRKGPQGELIGFFLSCSACEFHDKAVPQSRPRRRLASMAAVALTREGKAEAPRCRPGSRTECASVRCSRSRTGWSPGRRRSPVSRSFWKKGGTSDAGGRPNGWVGFFRQVAPMGAERGTSGGWAGRDAVRDTLTLSSVQLCRCSGITKALLPPRGQEAKVLRELGTTAPRVQCDLNRTTT